MQGDKQVHGNNGLNDGRRLVHDQFAHHQRQLSQLASNGQLMASPIVDGSHSSLVGNAAAVASASSSTAAAAASSNAPNTTTNTTTTPNNNNNNNNMNGDVNNLNLQYSQTHHGPQGMSVGAPMFPVQLQNYSPSLQLQMQMQFQLQQQQAYAAAQQHVQHQAQQQIQQQQQQAVLQQQHQHQHQQHQQQQQQQQHQPLHLPNNNNNLSHNANDSARHIQFQTPVAPQFNQPIIARTPTPGSGASATNFINIGGSMNPGAKKRQRRSDHALPGDDGDTELKELAYKALEVPFEEFAFSVKMAETSVLNSNNNNNNINNNNNNNNINNGNSNKISQVLSISNSTSASASTSSLSLSSSTSKNGGGNGGSGSKTREKLEEASNRERKRQIFAMVCLIRLCEVSSNAVVPRNRIYSRYAAVCANNKITPLSAASFGKLVRILFPNISTRRLGMRGQSKYHYCGIKLVGDTLDSVLDSPVTTPSYGSPFPNTPAHTSNMTATNSPMSIISRTSSISNINNNAQNSTTHSGSGSHLGVGGSPSTEMTPLLDLDVKYFIKLELKFVPNLMNEVEKFTDTEDYDFALHLVPLQSFLPAGTDYDVAETLQDLYKSYCTSVFEALRYMQLKKLFHIISSFPLSLTPPVYKLFVSESVLPWIINCDLVMYQSIMKMLSKIALQEVPPSVLQQLHYISRSYPERISVLLKNLPTEFIRAKLKLTEQFSRLVSRLIRVVETTQTAFRVLAQKQDRNLMLDDWLNCNFKEIVDRELPCSNQKSIDKVLNILQNQVPELLRYSPEEELKKFKGETALDESDDKTNHQLQELLVSKWSTSLIKIPEQFSPAEVPARMFLLCMSSLLTTALREISLSGGAGFGAWWVVRCWVDEWLGWCAELGGFQEQGERFGRNNQKENHQRKNSSEVKDYHHQQDSADTSMSSSLSSSLTVADRGTATTVSYSNNGNEIGGGDRNRADNNILMKEELGVGNRDSDGIDLLKF
ncbi:hypothetical protein PACTADRAFT_82537 [Pachysolen tannophilus NRRL Y-2460]|uniref:RFX-type winged-helix domain-containing protein n=1 Tax=Pachysolen tannophilus NRRL Y-2460 TaxID=669874 RepID=A0A1E4TN47_PACTA|nr:hypothetical protein PACTADRAFT_82537 [Pachysolen tannophilus NRRL Y-2460]